MNDYKQHGKMASNGSKKPRPTSFQAGYEDVLKHGRPQYPECWEYMEGYDDACYRIKRSKQLKEEQTQ
jgi:hypothetical protein